jgi:hypothetical protein
MTSRPELLSRLSVCDVAGIAELANALLPFPGHMLLIRHGNARRHVLQLAFPMAAPRKPRDVMPEHYHVVLTVSVEASQTELYGLVWKMLSQKARIVCIDPRSEYRAKRRRCDRLEHNLRDFLLSEIEGGALPHRHRQLRKKPVRLELKSGQAGKWHGPGRPSILQDDPGGFA